MECSRLWSQAMAFSRLGALELDGSAQGYDPRLFITYSPPFYNILRVTCVPSLSLGVQFCRSGNHAAAPVLVCWSDRGVLLLGRALSARLAGCGVCSPDVSDRCPHPSGRFRGSSIRAGQVWRRLRHDDATSAWHGRTRECCECFASCHLYACCGGLSTARVTPFES